MEYALLGEKLAHSYSKEIHALLGDYGYEHVELAPAEFRAFVMRREFKGVNVTIPYKRLAFELCDELSTEAKRLKNVNTIIRERDGRLVGHNTDYYGLSWMIRRSGINPKGKKTVVLGASGGAALTALAVLEDLGAHIVPVSRRGPVTYDALYREHADAEIIVNATPVGMYPDVESAPVELDRLNDVRGVLELIYNPHVTSLMLDARARGIPCENGLSMLVAQAARAKELFTGEPAPDDLIDGIRRRLCREKLNIVLIGMPGCGKTSIGRKLSCMMGREFIDVDAEIEVCAGISIPEIFERYGEARFREMERETIFECAKRRQAVISTGGGAPLNACNMRALSRSGVIIRIERAIECLETNGRPLSKDTGALMRMARQRGPIYEAAARFTVKNFATVELAARAALEGFYEAASD